ncbi:MAG: PQQ-like beta-propeller repeat protein [Gemmataceae bacterium]|nr:PQQ-like beta-propeller repeat protein [Gemmataceae bacterium]
MMLALFLLLAADAEPGASDWPMFRGPKRDNLSPDKGLLKTWPKDGPKLLWKAEGAGVGFSSVVVSAGRVFTMGTSDGKTFIHAWDAKKGGKPLWSAEVGKGGRENYEGTRCTPAVSDGLVYGLSAYGDFACVTADKGETKWAKNLGKDFGGSSGGWQYSESPLVDGKRVIVTPGGSKALMAALDKKTGEEAWRTAGGDASGSAGYSSAVVSHGGGVKQYVQLVGKGTIGVRASDGKLLWRYDAFSDNTANVPTPIVLGDKVLTAAGYGKAASLLALSKDGDGVKFKEEWTEGQLRNKHGGVLVAGDRMFGDTDDGGRPYAAEWKTGKTLWRRGREGKGGGSASLTWADGMLYIRYQDGWMALVPATGDKYVEKSGFRIPGVRRESWSHPVVIGGRLYLREDDAILCYDVKKGE